MALEHTEASSISCRADLQSLVTGTPCHLFKLSFPLTYLLPLERFGLAYELEYHQVQWFIFDFKLG